MNAHHDLLADALLSYHNSGPLLLSEVSIILPCTDTQKHTNRHRHSHTHTYRPYVQQLQCGSALLALYDRHQGEDWRGGRMVVCVWGEVKSRVLGFRVYV